MLDYPLLDIAGLSTIFNTDDGAIRAVDDVSFSINRGQTLGIVGESGCGKSVTGLSILQLQSPGHITQLAPKSEEMRSIRGNDIAMIFQEPMTSLNPVYTIGNQISEAVVLHQQVSKKEARSRSIEMLERVGIPAPHKRVDDYPHQFSGGMRQRAMIAMAVSCNPSLLIADEPPTALDVTIQAQVLDLMRELQEELGMAIMMITHDLGVIAEITNEIVIMYAGRVVEKGNLDQIFYHPLHPYTRGLLASIPVLGADSHKQLHSISGSVPRPSAMPPGCAFAPRCAERFERCDEMPELKAVGEHNSVRCWLHESN